QFAATMSVMCGLMAGSLVVLWPFQRDLSPETMVVKEKEFKPMFPQEWGVETISLFILIALSSSLVLTAHYLTMRMKLAKPEASPRK
ncbi:MAG TPA: hypothetical protein PKA76_04065, partial [Pirellulaceae bacterium]|nr:hypothetical protein [Pirellulaceae bacterium]